jgi:cell wall-associated NlpC family hydrolase
LSIQNNQHNQTYKYIGIPWVLNGRDKNGVDCLGMVWLYLHDQGIDFPDGDDQPINEASLKTLERRFFVGLDSLTGWRRLNLDEAERLRKNDVVLIHFKNLSAHLGVMVDSQNMLHSAISQTSEICRVDIFGHRVLGFWRRL